MSARIVTPEQPAGIVALTDIARETFLRFGKGRDPAQLDFGDCASCALAKAENAAPLLKGDDFAGTPTAVAAI